VGSARTRSRPRGLSTGRLVAAVVLCVIAALYVGPVEKYLAVRRDLHVQQAALVRLGAEHATLLRQEAALHQRPTVILYARSCGWVFPWETAMVVRGLPAGRCG
jgi:hypothetical protein